MIKQGDIIISSPYADTGIIFSKSVIYILAADNNAITGVIINKLLNQIGIEEIVKTFDLEKLKNSLPPANLPIYFGGPINQEKAIMIHSSDYTKNSFNAGDQSILINVDGEILKDVAVGVGPKDRILTMGYTAWSTPQLVSELKRNDWIIFKNSDKQAIYNLIFVYEPTSKWSIALELTGINLMHFSNLGGNA